TNTTSSRSNSSATSLAATRWPWWIGSNVPPMIPTRVGVRSELIIIHPAEDSGGRRPTESTQCPSHLSACGAVYPSSATPASPTATTPGSRTSPHRIRSAEAPARPARRSPPRRQARNCSSASSSPVHHGCPARIAVGTADQALHSLSVACPQGISTVGTHTSPSSSLRCGEAVQQHATHLSTDIGGPRLRRVHPVRAHPRRELAPCADAGGRICPGPAVRVCRLLQELVERRH